MCQSKNVGHINMSVVPISIVVSHVVAMVVADDAHVLSNVLIQFDSILHSVLLIYTHQDVRNALCGIDTAHRSTLDIALVRLNGRFAGAMARARGHQRAPHY
jgi:hypothetical protein